MEARCDGRVLWVPTGLSAKTRTARLIILLGICSLALLVSHVDDCSASVSIGADSHYLVVQKSSSVLAIVPRKHMQNQSSA